MLATSPAHDCALCPRLYDFRQQNIADNPTWFNQPVPSFGSLDSRLLIVGLAPGLQGANRTGRPFTGDYAGDLLYQTLLKFGLANGTYAAHAEDGLELIDCTITNAVRCVPPQNKPVGQEIKNCRLFLQNTFVAMKNLKAILVLGRIAHDSTLSALGKRKSAYPFQHAAHYELEGPNGKLHFFDSYHCSRYNTNTGRLTEQMFEEVFAEIKKYL